MKIKIDKISILLISIAITCRPFLDNLFMNSPIYIVAFAIILLTIHTIKNKAKPIKHLTIFSTLLIIISLYSNSVFSAGSYKASYFLYLEAILLGIIIGANKCRKELTLFLLKCLGIFAIATSVITWISVFNPQFYINRILTLLPKANRPEILLTFTKLSARPGLTSSYSRNGTFVCIGIIYFLSIYLNTKSKKYLAITLLLAATLLVIGKRAHALFIIISIIIGLLGYHRITIKSIVRLTGALIVTVLTLTFIVKLIPEAGYLFSRIDSSNKGDFSSGRIQMYEDGLTLYSESNPLLGIGWGQYALSTNYYHPTLHNDYLQYFVEMGIIGFAIFATYTTDIIIKCKKYAKEENSNISFVCVSYITFVLLYSITGSPRMDIDTLVLFQAIQSIIYTEKTNREGRL